MPVQPAEPGSRGCLCGAPAAHPGEVPILIDEWQRAPAVWDAVRRLVDDDPSGGRFVLTGSPPGSGTHSGAGRITTVRMRTLSLPERGLTVPTVSLGEMLRGRRPPIRGRSSVALADYVDEILAGGFPGMRRLTGRALEQQLDGYVERIVTHDLGEAGFVVRRPATVMAWMRAYAAATGTTASWETVRDAATSGVANKPAKTTTIAYVELLTSLRVLDPVEAWSPTWNDLSRLTSTPKHHLVDAVLSVRTLAGVSGARTYHLRTKGGRQEIDFVVEGGEGVVALEVKLSGAIGDRDVRNLRWLREQIGDELIDAVVLTTGPDAYRRPGGIAVVPLALLGP